MSNQEQTNYCKDFMDHLRPFFQTTKLKELIMHFDILNYYSFGLFIIMYIYIYYETSENIIQ